MPAASRVTLVPPERWDEARLVEAAKALAPTTKPIRPGDEVAGLVVVKVEPEPGASLAEETEMEVAPDPRETATPSVDIAILLDVSESMDLPWSRDHTRIDAAHESVRAFLAKPGGAVAEVTMIQYAKDAKVVAGPAAPDGMTLPIAPKPKGRSATGTALNAALAVLAGQGGKRAQAILLLSDGVGEVDEVRAAAARAARLRIPVHCLVFAPTTDEVFDEIARITGGTAQRATLPLIIEFEHEVG